MLDKKTLLQIKKLGIQTDWNDAFAGKSKGNKHLLRVVKLAKFIAKRLGANMTIVEAGAWLHDTALPSGNDYNYKKNKGIVKDMLHNFNLSSEDLDMIAECVASHEGTSKIKTLEAEIVHDADVLEKTGVLGIIRHTWKLTNSEKISHTHVTKKDAEEVLRHLHWRAKKLQTSLGRKMGRHLSIVIPLNQVQVIISIVAEKAFVGIVTEKIARLLYKKLTVPQKEKLQEQLNMSYLKKF